MFRPLSSTQIFQKRRQWWISHFPGFYIALVFTELVVGGKKKKEKPYGSPVPSLMFLPRPVRTERQEWSWIWNSQQTVLPSWCMMIPLTGPPTDQDHWANCAFQRLSNWTPLPNTDSGRGQREELDTYHQGLAFITDFILEQNVILCYTAFHIHHCVEVCVEHWKATTVQIYTLFSVATKTWS